ncbi:S-layer homology domain-containing protein [Bacillus infantis]|uniref:S-layer homology domain-containing protein n=1 Tax=Bacillus infantis TaxID=324767 RepID=UPI003CE8361F
MKKWLLAATALSASILLASPASAASYSDVSDNYWAKKEIDKLTEKGVIGGYPDGTFKPSKSVTRIQAAAMIVKALGLERKDEKEPDYIDISAFFPQRDIVDIMNETGIMRGEYGMFRPYEPVTRAQMASILTRAFELNRNDSFYFTDIQPDFWNYSEINALAASGITGGKGDHTFAPSEAASRAQFSVFLSRAIDTDIPRTPIEPLAGEHGEFVQKDGWLYGVEGNDLIKWNKENGKKTILTKEEVEEYLSGDKELMLDPRGFTENTSLQLSGGKVTIPFNHAERTVHNISPRFKMFALDEESSTISPSKFPIKSEDFRHPYVLDGKIYYIMYSDVVYYFENETVELRSVDLANGKDKLLKTFKTGINAFEQNGGDLTFRSEDLYANSPFNIDYSGSKIYYYNAEDKKVKAQDLITGSGAVLYSGEVEALRTFKGKLYLVTSSSVISSDLKGENRKVLAKGKTTLIDEKPEGLEFTVGGKKVLVKR